MSQEPEQRTKRGRALLRLASEHRTPPAIDPTVGPIGAELIKGAPDGIAILDEEGAIEAWNPAAERLFMVEAADAIGRDLVALLFPEHLQHALRAVLRRQLLESDASLAQRQLEVAARRANGDEVPIDLTASPIGSTDRPMLAVYLRDASERSERERELHADARRRSAVIDLGQLALEGMNLDELLHQAVSLSIDELKADRCEIWRHNEESNELELKAGSGWPRREDVVRTPIETANQPGYTLLRGQGAIVVEDYRREGRFQAVEPIGSPSVQSSVSVRIPGGDGGFGVLAVAVYSPRRFELSDVSLMESLAQLLGAAIERVRVSDSLHEAEHRVRTIIERLPSITYRAGLGPGASWEFISPQVEEILGYTIEEWMKDGTVWESRMHPDDLDRVLAEETRCATSLEPLDVEYRMHTRDGRVLWMRDRASVGTPDEHGIVIVEGLITDISEQKAAEDKLRHLADHDELTGLLNRRGFEQAVDEVIKGGGLPGGRGALIIVDLDHLKRINDSLGRVVGDRVVAEIADLLGAELGGGDGYVFGRLGSDEFGLLVPGVGQAQAIERASSLLSVIRSRQGAATLTASAGVALVEEAMGVGSGELLTAADIATHQAKEEGRDRVVLFTGEDRSHLEWVGHVRRTIEEDRLVLFSQPIVEMGTGAPASEELLVRMIDPVSGRPISAGEFVPTAERFGLIHRLDHWVVGQAIDLIASGRRVSANISAASINDRDLTTLVTERLASTGADPSLLTFEITETAATPAIELLRDFTERVEQIGCGLSLDDVGTGFGSLTYLRHLPFNQLKIDMQFVRGMLESKADAHIVESLVVIARGLGMTTVAEGVENPDLIPALQQLGVTFAQGYLFGRPAPVAATSAAALS